ncbi:MAG TPA: FIST N-terminal domain-containing protein, partial [Kofleriaceae bacterium]
LTHSHDAVHRAAAALGTSADALEPGRHVAITLVDGRYDREEAFCIGTAAAAPRIRFVGGCTSTDLDHGDGASPRTSQTSVWVNGEVLTDAGVVVVLESDQPFHAVTSAHLVPTELKTVVTAVSGRVIEQLDGRPAAPRLRQLIASIGDRLDEPRPAHAFARYLDGVPYVRSLHEIAGDHLVLTCAVEPGHVLRVMQPGDLLGATRRDLATATTRLGGSIAAFLAFSSTGRHDEAVARGTDRELAAAYAACHAVGFHTASEQSGMLLVNHTLTGLAIGAPKS